MSTPLQLEQYRRQQGFMKATQRPRCGNCKHERGAYNAQSPGQCGLGGFVITQGAICDRWQPNRSAMQGKPLSP